MINNSIFCHEYLYAISVSILNTSLIISFETNIISAVLFSNVVPLMLRHISAFLQHYIWETDFNAGYVLNVLRLIDLFILLMAIPVRGHAKIAD